ncbi:MAG: sterol-binding protein [Cycloclasticus sp. symbiont of Poecilosclerida sp. M]|nr:MAG: sterol-binding protein [Cycloclasticus sp. symbiont of Poecilosclerida sp. M]
MSVLTPFVKPLQIAINRYLAYDPEASKQLAKMQNGVVELHFKFVDISLFIMLTADGLDICDEFDGDADTKISGSPLALALMGLQESSTSSLFSGDVVIEGNTELGNQFQQFLKNIEVDWEEPLSKITGDVIANQAGEFVRDFSARLKESSKTNGLNVSEFLREEQHILPSKFEVGKFKKQVDEMRLSVDRLEAKAQRLIAAKDSA